MSLNARFSSAKRHPPPRYTSKRTILSPPKSKNNAPHYKIFKYESQHHSKKELDDSRKPRKKFYSKNLTHPRKNANWHRSKSVEELDKEMNEYWVKEPAIAAARLDEDLDNYMAGSDGQLVPTEAEQN